MKSIFKLLLCALLLSGCKKPEAPKSTPPVIDQELRTFLGIHTLNAPFTLPTSAVAYYPVTFLFESGKEVARIKGPVMEGVGPLEFPLERNVQLLWQSEGKQFVQAKILQGLNSRDLGHSDYWEKLCSVGASGTRSVRIAEGVTHDGIPIIGLHVSSRNAPQLYPTSQSLAAAGDYVVAIGVVFGNDREALEKGFLSSEK